jgi:hypothetical protein
MRYVGRVALLAVGAAGVMVGPASVVHAKAGTSCVPSSYMVANEDLVNEPRIAAALAAGEYTEAELTAVVEDVIDVNDDGYICLKEPSNLRGQSTKSWGFYYLGGDNNHPDK